MAPQLAERIKREIGSTFSSLFDPRPVVFRERDEVGLRPIRTACSKPEGGIHLLRKPLNRNAFLVGCLDFTEHEPIEHLIVGLGLRHGVTTKVNSTIHSTGTESSVEISCSTFSAIQDHFNAGHRAEVLCFHNHPRNKISVLFDHEPLASELLQRSEEAILPAADTEYREITVRLWGNGVVERGRVLGASLSGRRFVAHAGQFIASRIDARNGAMGLVPASLEGAIVTSDFPLFDLNTDLLEPAFLDWLCQTVGFVDLCLRASEGTTNRVRLQEARFLALEIPLPPLAEQRRVVVRIEELAAQIQQARTLRHQAAKDAEALVGAKASAVFRSAIQNGSVRLESMATLERGKFHHRPRNEPRFFGGAHPWIQIGEIESSNKYIRSWMQTLNDDGLAISKKFPRGTMLVSIAATIGAVGILDFDCCIPDSIVGVRPKPQTESEFLYHYHGEVGVSIRYTGAGSYLNARRFAVVAVYPAGVWPAGSFLAIRWLGDSGGPLRGGGDLSIALDEAVSGGGSRRPPTSGIRGGSLVAARGYGRFIATIP